MAKSSTSPRYLPIAPPTACASESEAAPTAESTPDAPEGADRLLQVGDIARATGKTVRAIHHYEELGLLQPHARSKGRFRLYDGSALTRVRWIGKLHDLGLSLGEIQQMVSSWEASPSAPDAMGRMRHVYEQKLAETRSQIQHLLTLERELVASLAYLRTCTTSCDPVEIVAACSNCNHRDQQEAEPELVAGIHSSPSRAPSVARSGAAPARP